MRPEAQRAGTASRRVRPTLGALVLASAWLGVTGFGGGLSVLGAMHDLLVVRRRWLTEREFLTTATVSQMLPGGAASNALGYTGLRFFGVPGALAAYAAFIAPGAILVTALAAAYVRLGVSPRLAPLFGGLNAAVVGIVASITLQMVRTGVSRAWQMGIAAGALLFALAGDASAGEIAALGIGSGLVLDLGTKRLRLERLRRHGRKPPPPVALPDEGAPYPRQEEREPEPAPAHAPGRDPERASERGPERAPGRGPERLGAVLAAPLPAGGLASLGALGALAAMAILFVRAGLGAYGGGFAIIPHLQSTVLAEGWLTAREFADAVAIGKATPGPVLLMATFIGYLVHGVVGAVVATAAVFAGPIALVVAVGAWLARLRSRRPVRAALRGLTPAVVGLMAAAALTLGEGLDGPVDLAIAVATLLTLTRFRVNPVILMVAGGALRLALRAAGV